MPRTAIILLLTCLVVPLGSQNTPASFAGGAPQILTADDVLAVLSTAAGALGNDTLAAAVVDRTGAILGVYARPNADERSPARRSGCTEQHRARSLPPVRVSGRRW